MERDPHHQKFVLNGSDDLINTLGDKLLTMSDQRIARSKPKIAPSLLAVSFCRDDDAVVPRCQSNAVGNRKNGSAAVGGKWSIKIGKAAPEGGIAEWVPDPFAGQARTT